MKQENPITNRYENIQIFGCFYFILFFFYSSLLLNLWLFFFRHTLLSIRLSFSMLTKHCLVLWKYSEKLEFFDYFHVFEHKSYRFYMCIAGWMRQFQSYPHKKNQLNNMHFKENVWIPSKKKKRFFYTKLMRMFLCLIGEDNESD